MFLGNAAYAMGQCYRSITGIEDFVTLYCRAKNNVNGSGGWEYNDNFWFVVLSCAAFQDSPGAKMTYSAFVRVPAALTALMSAVPQDVEQQQTGWKTGKYQFPCSLNWAVRSWMCVVSLDLCYMSWLQFQDHARKELDRWLWNYLLSIIGLALIFCLSWVLLSQMIIFCCQVDSARSHVQYVEPLFQNMTIRSLKLGNQLT